MESRFVGIKRESSGEICVETRFVGVKRESSGGNCVESRFVGIERESSGGNDEEYCDLYGSDYENVCSRRS